MRLLLRTRIQQTRVPLFQKYFYKFYQKDIFIIYDKYTALFFGKRIKTNKKVVFFLLCIKKKH